jgi:hypothetical protein
MNKTKLIGISAQSPVDRVRATKHLAEVLNYELLDYDTPMYETLNFVTGTNYKSNEEMEAYLGREWSYVRDEKFMENGEVVFKPVRYYLTPKQVFTKLRYNMRDIHPDFWINSFYNNNYFNPKIGGVIAVRYPNEADGVIDHGGIMIRINNLHNRSVVTKENLLMDEYECDYIVDVDSEGMIKSLNEALCEIEKQYPDVFTIK